ncbi:uncharacterized protein LOC127278871 [Leptopilina boulardi]|uniref:uncharacterized protein LOC127278871 n=1 Tax=Leptopilina boulardi TaxID=63433 RepID=UPI0021F6332B|nr:uncharacterized protein LOC127278871 [Leptopilina boulardi]
MSTMVVSTPAQSIVSPTMAPNVLKQHEAFGKLNLSPEFKRLMRAAEIIDKHYSEGGWEFQQSQCRAKIGQGYSLTHHQHARISSPQRKTANPNESPIAQNEPKRITNPTPENLAQNSHSTKEDEDSQRVPSKRQRALDFESLSSKSERNSEVRSRASRGNVSNYNVSGQSGDSRSYKSQEDYEFREVRRKKNRDRKNTNRSSSEDGQRKRESREMRVNNRDSRADNRDRRRGYKKSEENKRRWNNSLDSSSNSESESDSQISQSEDREENVVESIRRSKVLKTLKEWDLKFKGYENENAEVFLERLSDCRDCATLSDKDILQTLPIILQGDAIIWFRTLRHELKTWRSFKRAFTNEYLVKVDNEEIIDELKSRTQGKDERISSYLRSFRVILGHMKYPLDRKRQNKIAFKGLLPEYRRHLDRQKYDSLGQMEKILRKFEKTRSLDEKYVPPPPKEKMLFPSAAYKGKSEKKAGNKSAKSEKVAALGNESGSEKQSSGSNHSTKKNKKKSKAKKNEKAQGQDAVDAIKKVATPTVSAQGTNETTDQTQPQFVSLPIQTFAAMVAGGPRPNFPKAFGQKGGKTGQSGAPTPASPKQFLGPCYTCQTVGHRASECPKRVCFACQQPGHHAKKCPMRQPQGESCLVCKTPGVTFLTCTSCATLRTCLGNGTWGAQHPFVPPLCPKGS